MKKKKKKKPIFTQNLYIYFRVSWAKRMKVKVWRYVTTWCNYFQLPTVFDIFNENNKMPDKVFFVISFFFNFLFNAFCLRAISVKEVYFTV